MHDSIAQLLSLDNKVAIVTGGATGIGEGIARVLAAAGARVVIGDLDAAGARRVADEIGGYGTEVDVTDPEAAREFVENTASTFGLHILVNNVGSYHEAGSILDQSRESWGRSIAINLESVFNCSKPAAKRLVVKGNGGAIVNIASVDGFIPCLGTGYDTAKAGVVHFTRSLAVDLAPHGIRVNAVSPGHVPVPTLAKMRSGEIPPLWPTNPSTSGLMGPMMRQRSSNIPLGRSGSTEEIGNAVLFLCSAASSYVTGHNLMVDGGWTLV